MKVLKKQVFLVWAYLGLEEEKADPATKKPSRPAATFQQLEAHMCATPGLQEFGRLLNARTCYNWRQTWLQLLAPNHPARHQSTWPQVPETERLPLAEYLTQYDKDGKRGRKASFPMSLRDAVRARAMDYLADCSMRYDLFRQVCAEVARENGDLEAAQFVERADMKTIRRIAEKMRLALRSVGTKSGKLPENVAELTALMIARCVLLIHRPLRGTSVPPALFINIDELFVLLGQCHTKTLAPVGEQIVSKSDAGEKRGVTATLAIAADGTLLVTQVIAKGVTKIGAFGEAVYNNAALEDHVLLCTNRDTHWQTIGTMKELVIKVIVPYVSETIVKYPGVQCAILQMDCAPVHVSDKFRSWLDVDLNASLTAPTGPGYYLATSWVPRRTTEVNQSIDAGGVGRSFKAAVRKVQVEAKFRLVQQERLNGHGPGSPEREAAIRKFASKKNLITLLVNNWLIRARQAIKADVIRKAFEKAHIAPSVFAAAAVPAAEQTVANSTIKTEFYVGAGGVRGKPDFAADGAADASVEDPAFAEAHDDEFDVVMGDGPAEEEEEEQEQRDDDDE